jgi:hypothetical protein
MLLKTALPGVSFKALAAFKERREFILTEAVHRQISTVAYSEKLENQSRQGFDFVLKTLEVALEFNNGVVLDNQITWAYGRLSLVGIKASYVLEGFEILAGVIKEQLPESVFEEVFPYLEWMLARQRQLMAGMD